MKIYTYKYKYDYFDSDILFKTKNQMIRYLLLLIYDGIDVECQYAKEFIDFFKDKDPDFEDLKMSDYGIQLMIERLDYDNKEIVNIIENEIFKKNFICIIEKELKKGSKKGSKKKENRLLKKHKKAVEMYNKTFKDREEYQKNIEKYEKELELYNKLKQIIDSNPNTSIKISHPGEPPIDPMYK